jgi:hypothetical protein
MSESSDAAAAAARVRPAPQLRRLGALVGHNQGRRRVVKSRSWTAGERPWNGWRPGDGDLPEPVILPRVRGG